MYIKVREWNLETNTDTVIAVWGDSPEYPESIRSIVRDILEHGYAERGDSIYEEEKEDY